MISGQTIAAKQKRDAMILQINSPAVRNSQAMKNTMPMNSLSTIMCCFLINVSQFYAVGKSLLFENAVNCLAANVGFLNVKKRVQMTDMCLFGCHVANMLGNMFGTCHQTMPKKLPTLLNQNVACQHVGTILVKKHQTLSTSHANSQAVHIASPDFLARRDTSLTRGCIEM